MIGRDGLTIAVPRGALFTESLDLLDLLGIDTALVRENDRRLIFEELGIITMRPSDVPAYVEHGAADVGVTGKDVLLEQSEREVYDPAVGFAIGGGGRYDDLLGRYGRPLPACGVALDIHRVHVAQLEEERQA